MSTVSWGMRQRYKFVSCGALRSWVPPMMPAVYAITYKQDPHNKPKAHTVLYFGESEDLSQQAMGHAQWVVDYWRRSGGGMADDLFVFIHPMSGSSSHERSKVCERLVNEYQPHVNDV